MNIRSVIFQLHYNTISDILLGFTTIDISSIIGYALQMILEP